MILTSFWNSLAQIFRLNSLRNTPTVSGRLHDVKFDGRGTVKPPPDLHKCAKDELGNEYSLFVSIYGENFTGDDLVRFIEDR